MAGRQLERAHHNVQATLIPAGCAAIVQFKMSVLDTFIIVDHSIERALNHGALAQLKVMGSGPARLFGQAVRSRLPARGDRNPRRSPGCSGAGRKDQGRAHPNRGRDLRRQLPSLPSVERRGRARPVPIAGEIRLPQRRQIRAIKTVTGRLEAKLTVNGHDFSGVMPSWSLSDEESPMCDFRLNRHFTIDAIV
jgi:nitrite reductase (NO-forming)